MCEASSNLQQLTYKPLLVI